MKMIGMGMGQQHGIEPRDASIEQLLAKIRRRIDQQRPRHRLSTSSEQRRRRLRGSAGIAAAPVRTDRRHPP